MRLKIPICVLILFLNVGRKYQTTHLKPHYSANFTTVPVLIVHHNWCCSGVPLYTNCLICICREYMSLRATQLYICSHWTNNHYHKHLLFFYFRCKRVLSWLVLNMQQTLEQVPWHHSTQLFLVEPWCLHSKVVNKGSCWGPGKVFTCLQT